MGAFPIIGDASIDERDRSFRMVLGGKVMGDHDERLAGADEFAE
jgi:hypothetical protein